LLITEGGRVGGFIDIGDVDREGFFGAESVLVGGFDPDGVVGFDFKIGGDFDADGVVDYFKEGVVGAAFAGN
jgi:hypothetical protein